jgi:hypothetical protein
MRIISIVTLFAVGIGITSSSAARCQTAPQSLRGKSIIITWTEYQNVRWGGRANFQDVVIPFSRRFYISTAGRPFVRFGQTTGGQEATEDIVEAAGPNNAGNQTQTSFTARTMTAIFGRGGHARRISVTFNENLSACQAQIVFAKQLGQDIVMGRNMRTGQPVEMRSSKAAGVSCSVREGNVFAQ